MRPSTQAAGVIGVFSDQDTPIRGLSWYLHSDDWGRGLMGDAALVVVDHLLGLPGIDGVEAWIDSRNTRSVGVARRARLDLVGRLPRVYAAETAQSLVMARRPVGGPTRWNESHAIDLRRSTEEIQPAAIALEVGVPVDPVHQAVVAAGLEATDPSDMPWYRRQFTLRLSEGHALTISGPVKPSSG